MFPFDGATENKIEQKIAKDAKRNMKERAVPFLVFADLAFFLFAILVLSYQYVQVVESGDVKILTDSFLVDLVRLPFAKNQDRAAAPGNTTNTIEVAVLKDGTFLINGKLVVHNDLKTAFQPFDKQHCRLLVDRLARAEALVFVLGLLEKQHTKSIEIEFIPETATSRIDVEIGSAVAEAMADK